MNAKHVHMTLGAILIAELSCKNGQNPATEALERVTQCAAMARGPTPTLKSRKLVFFRHLDKEDLIQELQNLKSAVLDQTYHFQLHKIQLVSLRDQHKYLDFSYLLPLVL